MFFLEYQASHSKFVTKKETIFEHAAPPTPPHPRRQYTEYLAWLEYQSALNGERKNIAPVQNDGMFRSKVF